MKLFTKHLFSFFFVITIAFLNNIAAQTKIDTILASKYYTKAETLLKEGKNKESIRFLEKSKSLYLKVKVWEKTARCLNEISYIEKLNSNFEESLKKAKKALEICEFHLQKNNREKAHAYDNIGHYYEQSVRDYKTASKYFNKALNVRYKIFSKNHKEIALSYDKIGVLYHRQGFIDKALKYYQKSLNTRIQVLGNDHYITGSSYGRIGMVYRRQGKYKEAIINYRKQLENYVKKYGQDHIRTAFAHFSLGETYSYLSDNEKAEFHLNKSLEIKIKSNSENQENIAHNYYSIGNFYKNIGKYKISKEYYIKALELYVKLFGKESTHIANTYYSLGRLYGEIGFHDYDLNYRLMSLDIYLKYKKNHPNIGKIYNGIGAAYKAKGLLESASEYFKKSMDFSISRIGKDNYQVATTYINLANVYKDRGKYDLALPLYNMALMVSSNSVGKNHPKTALVLNNFGDLEMVQEKNDPALEYYQKALKIYTTHFNNTHRDVAYTLNKIGVLKLKMGLYYEAISYFEKALKIQVKLYNNKNKFISKSENNIAFAYFRQQDYKKALFYYNQAITDNTKEKSNEFFDPNIALTSLEGVAKTYTQLYQKHQDTKHLDNAIASYQKADTLIGTIRQTLTNYQDKVTFAQKAKEVYQGAIAAQLLQKDQESLAQAFVYTEKSKANTLKELLRDANAKNFTGLPTNLLTLEKELRTNRAFYLSAITKQQSKTTLDTAKIREYESRLFDTNRKQDSLITVLEKEYPKYYQLKHANTIISAIDIQAKLKDHTTLLEFFTTDSITYAFMVSKNKVAVQELATPNLTGQVEALRTSIIAKNTKSYKTTAHQLYQQLLLPLKDQLTGNTLIIVPDGPLWHLNFELLLTQNDASNNPADFSYLLRDYVISYANAANVLFANPYKDPIDTKKQECLAFSFSDSTLSTQANTMSMAALRGTDDDLPGTRKEIKAIADIIDGAYFYGSNAIEANFKKNANQYNILHLALHGEVDHERPENSRLFFTKNKDTIEDNLLYSHELFALDIPAELTVLSACNTGSGTIATGEGIMSLGSAFQYAGTKSLLLSSWDVSDQTTPLLMKYFYTHLKKGMSKAKALQQAKLQYLQTANINRTQPFYWGGFYLVGDPAPIPFEHTTIWYWILGIGILILLVSVGFYRFQQHSSR